MIASDAAVKRAYHFGNLREALIQTSLEVIADSGLKALTLREIGVRLGVSRMAPYRHFTDKAALLEEISEIGFTRFGDALETALHSRKGWYARLEEMGVAYVRFAMANQSHFEVMFGSGGEVRNLNEKGRQAADRAFNILVGAIAGGQRAGKFVGDEPTVAARMVWAMVHGISLLRLEKDPEGKAQFTRLCSNYLRQGIQRKSGKEESGGDDGVRTRDLRRDRPAF